MIHWNVVIILRVRIHGKIVFIFSEQKNTLSNILFFAQYVLVYILLLEFWFYKFFIFIILLPLWPATFYVHILLSQSKLTYSNVNHSISIVFSALQLTAFFFTLQTKNVHLNMVEHCSIWFICSSHISDWINWNTTSFKISYHIRCLVWMS